MNKFFNAHHSPVGSYSSFTLGYKGASGGLGNMLGKPADQDIYIGYGYDNKYQFLPFFDSENIVSIDNFTEDKVFADSSADVSVIADQNIKRVFNLGTDTFEADKLKFTIYTPHLSIDEDFASEQFKLAINPGLVAEIEFNNDSDKPCQVVFGFKQNNKSSSLRHLQNQNVGIIDGLETSIASDDENSTSVVHFTLTDALNSEFYTNDFNRQFMLGEVGLIITTIPPQTTRKIKYAINFFVDSTITSGIRTKFKYTQHFEEITDSINYTLKNSDEYIKCSLLENEWLAKQALDSNQKFQLAHAIGAYYGSTQILVDKEDRIYHLVNEGEYQMMQTFDLMIDHLFFELFKNPWVVKNNLQLFIERFMYSDKIIYEGKEYDAGISFTHDMGNINQFSLGGRSSYELTNISGCFSHMTYEQLTNFIITFMTYCLKMEDFDFMKKHRNLLQICKESLLTRDHPNPKMRNGLMSFDSVRVGIGKEITTYDSLDQSLGQARLNTYLASKTYASLCLLNEFNNIVSGTDDEQICHELNLLTNTIVNSIKDDKIPAVLNSEQNAYIIPVAEGLSYLKYLDLEKYYHPDGIYGHYIVALKNHTNAILKKDCCLFENDGYKLSSTSNMTWLSKIYLSQYVHTAIFDINRQIVRKSNIAHTNWLLDEDGSYWSWSDQILNFEVKGSKYYPRGVTAFLWTLA